VFVWFGGFWWDWDLNFTYNAGTVPFEPHPQSILWYFLENEGLVNCLSSPQAMILLISAF
jgi:hypothetical protein